MNEPRSIEDQMKIADPEAAVKNFKEVKAQESISRMRLNLEDIKGPDWAKFKLLLDNKKMTDEQRQAVAETISSLQAAMNVGDIDERLALFARAGKIVNVAVANSFFKAHIIPVNNDEKILAICQATHYLYEALGNLSNKHFVQEALELTGEAMTPEQMEETRKRLMKLKVS